MPAALPLALRLRSSTGQVLLHDFNTGQKWKSLLRGGSGTAAGSLSFSRLAPGQLAGGSGSGTLLVWDVDRMELADELGVHKVRLLCMAGRYGRSSLSWQQRWQQGLGCKESVAMNTCTCFTSAARVDAAVLLLSRVFAALLLLLQGAVTGLSFSEAGAELLLSCSADGTAKCTDRRTAKVRWQLAAQAQQLACSATALLVSASWKNSINSIRSLPCLSFQ